jgi:short-subunit dehydrogenase involved in D-alanine esterification of teichoic acids
VPETNGSSFVNTTGNTVFIPGATSGIGLGLALRLQDKGNTVIVGGRRIELLQQLAAEHPGLGTITIDTTDPASITAARDELTTRYPALDTLITMAGIMEPENLRDPASLDVAERTVEVNLLGPIRLINAFLPSLLAQTAATVMTVSSGLAYVPLPATPTYNATKAAIHSFTESLRVQLFKSNVQVIELVPPATRTTLMNQQNSDVAMPLEDFLDEVMSLLEVDPEAEQILVERVKWQRNAEAEGRYADVLNVLSGRYRS